MELHEFTAVLRQQPDKTLVFTLPGGREIPRHFHITEIGKVSRDFIDCGGTRRSTESCLLQTLVTKDTDHRLSTTKLATIVELASTLGLDDHSPVEAEVQLETTAIFSVASCEVAANELRFSLAAKRTACLAPETCGVEMNSLPVISGGGDDDCCGDTGCC